MKKKKPITRGTLFRDEQETPPGNFRTGMAFQVLRENEFVEGDWWCRSMNPTKEVGGGLYSYRESYIVDHLITNRKACNDYHVLGDSPESCTACFAALAFRRS